MKKKIIAFHITDKGIATTTINNRIVQCILTVFIQWQHKTTLHSRFLTSRLPLQLLATEVSVLHTSEISKEYCITHCWRGDCQCNLSKTSVYIFIPLRWEINIVYYAVDKISTTAVNIRSVHSLILPGWETLHLVPLIKSPLQLSATEELNQQQSRLTHIVRRHGTLHSRLSTRRLPLQLSAMGVSMIPTPKLLQ